ncbi:MAG: S26 family signal peptidase [Hyphomonadaceae bacterium]|nr:S26 family signal peptidase [Hyphomonadaceae bacterium]
MRHLSLASLVALCIGAAAWRAPPLVLFNPSPSVPEGFYLRTGGDLPARGDLVTIRARDAAPSYAAARGFDDESDRFIKRVAAVRGDLVCADGDNVRVRGRHYVRAQYDAAGRALPRWEGCRMLAHEVFLLGDTTDSFDGRYWGVTPLEAVEAVWRRI